ncbi:putative calcium-binding protein CML18 [Tasmannia lanceolata]|uniref:putative calcium-binding protein CML18 n=1 Tax=Tasmannia lanceolata TaxID=3420 RepID=UPI0040634968
MEGVEQVFKRFDTNGDGKITASELGDVMNALGSSTSPEELQRMMEEIDTDGDGFIDLKEFSNFLRDTGDVELRDAFKMFDVDNNGLISAKELHSMMKKLGEKCSLKDCERMIQAVDTDGDGSVDLNEFKKMMTKGKGSTSG